MRNRWTCRRLARYIVAGFFFLFVSSRGQAREQTYNMRARESVQPEVVFDNAERVFSKEWMKTMLSLGAKEECSPSRPVYVWRDVGWGSNINSASTEEIGMVKLNREPHGGPAASCHKMQSIGSSVCLVGRQVTCLFEQSLIV